VAVHRSGLSKNLVFLVVVAAALVMIPVVLSNPRFLHALIMTGLAVILATSNRLPLVGGIWHFGHIAFYAIGAYTALLTMSRLGLSFWLSLPLAGAISGAVALGFAYATSRVRGMYFALLTMTFIEVVRLTITYTPFLGGFRALTCPAPRLFAFEFATRVPYYYLVLALVAVTLLVLWKIEKSRIGEALSAIDECEPLAESIGVNVTRYRVFAFCTSAVFAGLAGAIYAPYTTVIGPSVFNMWATVVIWIQIVVGGGGSFWGPVVGAVFLVLLREYLPGTGAWENIFYAITVLGVLFFLPEGLVGLPRVVRERWFVSKPVPGSRNTKVGSQAERPGSEEK